MFLSVMGSIFKERARNCGSEYPIGMVLHTNLFCEIVKEQDNETNKKSRPLQGM